MRPSHESHLTESLDSDSEDWVQIEVSSEELSCFPEINSPDYQDCIQVIDCENSLAHLLSDPLLPLIHTILQLISLITQLIIPSQRKSVKHLEAQ